MELATNQYTESASQRRQLLTDISCPQRTPTSCLIIKDGVLNSTALSMANLNVLPITRTTHSITIRRRSKMAYKASIIFGPCLTGIVPIEFSEPVATVLKKIRPVLLDREKKQEFSAMTIHFKLLPHIISSLLLACLLSVPALCFPLRTEVQIYRLPTVTSAHNQAETLN